MRYLVVSWIFSGLLLSQTLWNGENGVAIRQGVHIEWQKTTAPGAADDVIAVWSDTRDGRRNVYAQKVSSAGVMQWGSAGAAVTNLPGRQEDPVAIEDGLGGAFIAWVDYRFDSEGDIFLQHIDGNGQIQLDANGIALCQQNGTQISIAMCTDSVGGAFITWQDKRNGVDDDIYGTHITADNSIVSPGNGVALINVSGNQFRKSIEYGGNQEAFLVWTDEREGSNPEIYGQRLTTAVTFGFDAGGLRITNNTGLDVAPRTTFMHGDTSLVTWQRGDGASNVLYQLVSSTGVIFENPRIVASSTAIKSDPRVKRDNLGNVFIVWHDLRMDPVNGNFYAQKIDPVGDIAWDSTGVLLDNPGIISLNARFTADESGGAWYFWEQGTFPEVDIVGVHVLSEGMITNLTVSDQAGYQFGPIAGGGSESNVFCAFADQSSGSVSLRIQHFDGVSTTFGDEGLLLKLGLDGDVTYAGGMALNSGILLAWEDSRSGKKAFGTWVDAPGDITDYNGIQLSFSDAESLSGQTEPIFLLTDESIYTASFSAETGVMLVRVNRLTHDYVNLWDSTGVEINPGSADQRQAVLVDMPAGLGCFWSEIRNSVDYDVYYQIFNAYAEPTLTDGGVLISSGQWVDDYVVAIVPTFDDHYIVIVEEDVWGGSKFVARKIDQNGVAATDWPSSGIIVAGPAGDPYKLSARVIDSDLGILLSWNQTNNFSADIKVQILHWDGTTTWPQGGIFATTADNDQTNLSLDITPDKSKALIVWEDFRNGLDYNIAGQIVDLTAGALQGENIVFTTDTSFQLGPEVLSLSDTQFLLVWEDQRGIYNADPVLAGGNDLYFTRFDIGDGTFTNDGHLLIQEFHRQENPQFTFLSPTELLIYWRDLRSSGKADFYSLYGKLFLKSEFLDITSSGVPKSFAIYPAFPNPFNGRVVFEFDVAEVAPVGISITNVLGQSVYDAVVMPDHPGSYSFTWNGTDIMNNPMASGIYFYQIKINDIIQKGKITYLK